MNLKWWTKKFEVNSFLVTPQKKLGIYSLLNLLQDSAWAHATRFGHGHEETAARNTIWVLTRQKLVMEFWPGWGEVIEVKTWIRPPQGPYANRDFEVYHGGRKIGESTTSWLMLNAETRKPIREHLTAFKDLVRDDFNLNLETEKLEVMGELETLAEFQVRNSDLDVNQHVNNTKYVQWLLDSMPLEWNEKTDILEYDVCFLSEVKSGDSIFIRKSTKDLLFQGWREADRKVVFTARIRA